jgi:hypothetical protein
MANLMYLTYPPGHCRQRIDLDRGRGRGVALGLSGFKASEDASALILRTYESAGARGRVGQSVAKGWRPANDLLDECTGCPDLSFSSFQMHSWQVEREES